MMRILKFKYLKVYYNTEVENLPFHCLIMLVVLYLGN